MTGPILPSGIVHPIPPPPGSTHFKLCKGGLNGLPCPWTDGNGVLQERIPLEHFDKDWITAQYGHDRDFRVMFFQETEPGKWRAKGTWKQFGLEAETADLTPSLVGEDGRLISPQRQEGQVGGAMGTAMAMVVGLKDMARSEAATMIEAYRVNADAQVQMARESGQQTLQIMSQFMTGMMAMNAQQQQRPAGPDPQLAQILQNQQKQLDELKALLEEDDEETEDEEAERRHKQLMRDVKRDGMGALIKYAKDLAAEQLIDELPKLKEMFPGLIKQFVAPMLKAKLAELAAMQAQASAPRPAPPPAPPVAPPAGPVFTPYVPPASAPPPPMPAPVSFPDDDQVPVVG